MGRWVDAYTDEWAGCMGRKVRACLVVGYVGGQVNKNKSNEGFHEWKHTEPGGAYPICICSL